jgi:hypothetical protein
VSNLQRTARLGPQETQTFERHLGESLDEVFSVNTTCFAKTMVNASIVVAALFQMTFLFPKTYLW